MTARALINVPAQAKKGDVITIKTLISHEMETGYRHDSVGKPIPRDIITSMVCTYNGEEIFNATLYPAISANPLTTWSRICSGVSALPPVTGSSPR